MSGFHTKFIPDELIEFLRDNSDKTITTDKFTEFSSSILNDKGNMRFVRREFTEQELLAHKIFSENVTDPYRILGLSKTEIMKLKSKNSYQNKIMKALLMGLISNYDNMKILENINDLFMKLFDDPDPEMIKFLSGKTDTLERLYDKVEIFVLVLEIKNNRETLQGEIALPKYTGRLDSKDPYIVLGLKDNETTVTSNDIIRTYVIRRIYTEHPYENNSIDTAYNTLLSHIEFCALNFEEKVEKISIPGDFKTKLIPWFKNQPLYFQKQFFEKYNSNDECSYIIFFELLPEFKSEIDDFIDYLKTSYYRFINIRKRFGIDNEIAFNEFIDSLTKEGLLYISKPENLENIFKNIGKFSFSVEELQKELTGTVMCNNNNTYYLLHEKARENIKDFFTRPNPILKSLSMISNPNLPNTNLPENLLNATSEQTEISKIDTEKYFIDESKYYSKEDKEGIVKWNDVVYNGGKKITVRRKSKKSKKSKKKKRNV